MTPRRGGRAPSAPRRHGLGAVFCALVLAGCHRNPAPTTVPPAPVPSPQTRSSVQRLQDTIDAALASPGLTRGTWGITVQSLTSGDTLYARNAGALMMPASTMKIVTLAAAAERLGWNFTFETRIARAGAVEAGLLSGDLVVVGSGDPSIDDWDGAATRTFGSWADRLKDAGILRVSGRLIGDDNAFDAEAIGAGWAWDDLAASYATGTGALQFNENTAQVMIAPGAVAGAPAIVSAVQPAAGLVLKNFATTSGADRPAGITLRPTPRDGTIEIRGSIPVANGRLTRNVSVANATLYFMGTLREALSSAGIVIGGGVADIDDVPEPPRAVDGVTIVTHRSEPLSRLAPTMMKLSQNLYAETLLKTLGVATSGTGSAEAGREAVAEVLKNWDISSDEVLQVDGSGLSRYNLATPKALVGVLAHVYNDERLRAPFSEALSIAGKDGTLSERMKGTPAADNVHAKTGSFSNARAVAGYVMTADGEALAFAILANNYGTPPALVDAASDAILVALAGFSRR